MCAGEGVGVDEGEGEGVHIHLGSSLAWRRRHPTSDETWRPLSVWAGGRGRAGESGVGGLERESACCDSFNACVR